MNLFGMVSNAERLIGKKYGEVEDGNYMWKKFREVELNRGIFQGTATDFCTLNNTTNADSALRNCWIVRKPLK